MSTPAITPPPLRPAKAGAGPWEATLPAIPPSANVQLRMHWASVRKYSTDWLWWMKLCFAKVPKATGCRHVTITRYGHGLLDEGDNLAASYKFVRDLLRPEKVDRGTYGPNTKTPGKPWVRMQAGTGMVIGDGPGEATFEYHQVKISRKNAPYTVIKISDTPA